MRLFFGIELDERSRRAATDCLNCVRRGVDGRFVLSDNLHMTLCFIGEVSPKELDAVNRIGEQCGVCTEKCELRLSKLGYFGKPSSAILYIGVDNGASFSNLALRLKEVLTDRGIACDPKPFSAHITIARMVNLTSENLDDKKPEPVTWTPEALTLFESARIDNRLTYTPIKRWRLIG